jgi:hypothetical protein
VILFRIPTCSNLGPSRDEVPERIKHTIDTEKSLISIICSVSGLDISKDISHNRALFSHSVVLHLFKSSCTQSQRKTLKGIIIYLDDGDGHNSRKFTECLEQLSACRIPDPADSPDLAPSNFCRYFMGNRAQADD